MGAFHVAADVTCRASVITSRSLSPPRAAASSLPIRAVGEACALDQTPAIATTLGMAAHPRFQFVGVHPTHFSATDYNERTRKSALRLDRARMIRPSTNSNAVNLLRTD